MTLCGSNVLKQCCVVASYCVCGSGHVVEKIGLFCLMIFVCVLSLSMGNDTLLLFFWSPITALFIFQSVLLNDAVLCAHKKIWLLIFNVWRYYTDGKTS